MLPAHPRGCGEHALPANPDTARGGSSPRLRGTPDPVQREYGKARLIPAAAGNTWCSSALTWRKPAHPRGCGEHIPLRGHVLSGDGSSPRLRGTPRVVVGHQVIERLIPAAAGNTHHPVIAQGAWPAHPRGCGEHAGRNHHRQAGRRLIPAAAGNTPPTPIPAACATAHPRGCGEHVPQCDWHCGHAGSSPRLRGTPRPCQTPCRICRLIPAAAGNTAAVQRRHRTDAAHPRGCGEHAPPGRHAVRRSGSSTRLRGTRHLGDGLSRLRRLIPAAAGNTPPAEPARPAMTAHPRGCGEHPRQRAMLNPDDGSSPRLRGTRIP